MRYSDEEVRQLYEEALAAMARQATEGTLPAITVEEGPHVRESWADPRTNTVYYSESQRLEAFVPLAERDPDYHFLLTRDGAITHERIHLILRHAPREIVVQLLDAALERGAWHHQETLEALERLRAGEDSCQLRNTFAEGIRSESLVIALTNATTGEMRDPRGHSAYGARDVDYRVIGAQPENREGRSVEPERRGLNLDAGYNREVFAIQPGTDVHIRNFDPALDQLFIPPGTRVVYTESDGAGETKHVWLGIYTAEGAYVASVSGPMVAGGIAALDLRYADGYGPVTPVVAANAGFAVSRWSRFDAEAVARTPRINPAQLDQAVANLPPTGYEPVVIGEATLQDAIAAVREDSELAATLDHDGDGDFDAYDLDRDRSGTIDHGDYRTLAQVAGIGSRPFDLTQDVLGNIEAVLNHLRDRRSTDNDVER